jgi:hypothetical protein
MVRVGGIAEDSRMAGFVVLQPIEGDAQDREGSRGGPVGVDLLGVGVDLLSVDVDMLGLS